MSSVMLALRGKPHHLQTCRAIYSHRFYAAAEAAKDEKEPLTEEEKSAKARHTAAQALAQTNNPVVLKAVESVMKGTLMHDQAERTSRAFMLACAHSWYPPITHDAIMVELFVGCEAPAALDHAAITQRDCACGM
mmetsp:Transcript_1044/g.3183  ORF Transcript_1044/g.3183 Transcript_1044/m.3183 type:complete len:135 (+) Transcript_1044:1359-1763(+)